MPIDDDAPPYVRFASDAEGVVSTINMRAYFQSNWNPLTAFQTQRPAKCLFVADGEPYSRVQDALVANEVGKVREIVLIFERPA